MSVWGKEMRGDCEYHIVTAVNDKPIGYVTRNDADEWVAAVYDRFSNATVIGSGYPTLLTAKIAVDEACVYNTAPW